MHHWGAASFLLNSAFHQIGTKDKEYLKKYSKNPFEEILEIYKLGLCPLGTDDKNTDNFIIWHPPTSQR